MAANLSADQLAYFSQVCASIMGVEADHRALGRVIGGQDPANNRCYQQTAGLDSVFTGPRSAVVALTPSLTPATGPAFSSQKALDKGAALTLPCELFGPPRLNHVHAAVDLDRLSVDAASGITEQKRDHGGNLLIVL